MGQELFDTNYVKAKRKYYLATNSKGHKVLRGSQYKEYTHATIYNELYNSGYCYATFTTRLDLAKRYSRNWANSEVVEVKEVTAKEARQLKKEIHEVASKFQEQIAQKTADIYEINREAV